MYESESESESDTGGVQEFASGNQLASEISVSDLFEDTWGPPEVLNSVQHRPLPSKASATTTAAGWNPVPAGDVLSFAAPPTGDRFAPRSTNAVARLPARAASAATTATTTTTTTATAPSAPTAQPAMRRANSDRERAGTPSRSRTSRRNAASVITSTALPSQTSGRQTTGLRDSATTWRPPTRRETRPQSATATVTATATTSAFSTTSAMSTSSSSSSSSTTLPQIATNLSSTSTAASFSSTCTAVHTRGKGSSRHKGADGRSGCAREIHGCQSAWAEVPDPILLNAIVLLGPADVCSVAKCCASWAESVTTSETWLWSVVGLSGMDPDLMRRLATWAKGVRLGLRMALQLWMCRGHLWSSGLEGEDTEETVDTFPIEGLAGAETGPLKAAVWPTAAASEHSVALAYPDGRLAFGSLAFAEAPAQSLRGQRLHQFSLGRVVRACHGQSLPTALRPLGSKLLSAGLDGLLRLWDPSSGEEEYQIITYHGRGISDVAMSSWESSISSAHKAVTCGDDGNVFMYELGERMQHPPVRSFLGHSAPSYCATWLSASTFITGGFDRKAILWDIRAPKPLANTLSLRQHAYSILGLDKTSWSGSASSSSSSSSSPSIERVAIGLGDGALTVWDLRHSTKAPLKELRGHSAGVECITQLPGNILATASSDGSLRLWKNDVETWHWTTPSRGPLTALSPLYEDTLLVAGPGHAPKASPTFLSLNYCLAAPRVPEVLDRLEAPILRPWKRGLLPPEGLGRHSALCKQRRLLRNRSFSSSSTPGPSTSRSASRGAFDRAGRGKPPAQGATASAHLNSLLCHRR